MDSESIMCCNEVINALEDCGIDVIPAPEVFQYFPFKTYFNFIFLFTLSK